MITARTLPVVHHRDDVLTLAQAELALSVGADGVFLIAHEAPDAVLFPLAQRLTLDHPDRLIGVNALGLSPEDALAQCHTFGLRALWVDAPGITSAGVHPSAKTVADRAQAAGIEFFASVAFKYQPHEPNPGQAALHAQAMRAIPTTSGAGTGIAPEVAKIQAMRQALGPRARLAIASGMTCANVHAFLPFATDFLVATGVSLDAYRFDPGALVRFIEQVRARP